MKITITGASGFIGQNLQQYLRKKRYEINEVSLRDATWRNHVDQNATAIVHLAGKAHDTANTSSEEEYFKINRDLTIEIFDFFLRSDIRDFFYFSSVKAVADTVADVLEEDVVGTPFTPYGKSKLEAEQYLLSRQLPGDKRLFVIRPCMIHGPGNKGNLNLLYKVVEKGIPWPLAEFHNQRSFLGIDNLNYLLDQILIRQALPSGVYNFADDDALSTNELVGLISEVLDKKPKFLCIPANIITRVVKIGDIIPLPLNSERLKKLTESYVVSNTKIKKAIGIDKLPLTSKEGLARTLGGFKKL